MDNYWQFFMEPKIYYKDVYPRAGIAALQIVDKTPDDGVLDIRDTPDGINIKKFYDLKKKVAVHPTHFMALSPDVIQVTAGKSKYIFRVVEGILVVDYDIKDASISGFGRFIFDKRKAASGLFSNYYPTADDRVDSMNMAKISYQLDDMQDIVNFAGKDFLKSKVYRCMMSMIADIQQSPQKEQLAKVVRDVMAMFMPPAVFNLQ